MKRLIAAIAGLCLLATSAIGFYQSRDSNYNAAIVTSGGGCTQATNFLARTSGLNGTHQTAYTTMICGMVTDGTWTLLDAFYVFATSTSTVALTNLVSSSFGGTITGTMTFTADSDYTPAAINSFVNTNYNPTTAGGQFTQNTAHASVWIKTLVNSQPSFGDISAVDTSQIFPNFGGSYFCRINDTTAGGVSNGANPGLFFCNRSGASAWQSYQNGVSASSGTEASTSLNNDAFSYPSADGANATGNPIMAGTIGGNMNSTQQAAFYARLHVYLQTIAGVP